MQYARRLLADLLSCADDGTAIGADTRAKLEQLAASLDNDETSATNQLRQFLIHDQVAAKFLGKALVARSFAFLDEQLDKYQTIKSERPLTPEELKYGRETLPALINSVVALCSRARSQGDDLPNEMTDQH